jgi:hypothetical protein
MGSRRRDDICSSFRDARNPGEHYCGLPAGHASMHECDPYDGVRWRLSEEEKVSTVDLGAYRDQVQKQGLLQSNAGVFKLKNGDNRIRVLDGPLFHEDSYKGKPNNKWLFHVLDRADGQVKPMFMSPVIFDMLADLQRDPDYEFDTFPMPFDINVKTTDAGTINARYSVIPSPKRAVISPEELALLTSAMPLDDFQRRIYQKRSDESHVAPSTADSSKTGTFDLDEIPF